MKRLTETAWTALSEALRTYYWFKRDFEVMVRGRFSDAPELLAQISFRDTKRETIGQLIVLLRREEATYQPLVIEVLLAMRDVDPAFPHLQRLTDGPEKVTQAIHAHQMVLDCTEQFTALADSRRRAEEQTRRSEESSKARHLHEAELGRIKAWFFELHQGTKPQARGIEFERLLNDLFDLWDLEPRASYSIEHEQVDGAFTFDTDPYILEARWWTDPLGPKELNDFRMKVDGKGRNTLGLCVSISGFTDGAVIKHSAGRTPLVLMDGVDLLSVLEGRVALDEVLSAKRRHAAETGNPLFRLLT